MAAQAKLQCSMCPPPFLITASRRRCHSLILLSMKRCKSFCHSVTIARFSSSTVLNVLVVDSLLKSTQNSVIHGIQIRAIWRPHVRFNEVDVLFFSDSPSWSGQCALALHPAAVSTCTVFVLLGNVVTQ